MSLTLEKGKKTALFIKDPKIDMLKFSSDKVMVNRFGA